MLEGENGMKKTLSVLLCLAMMLLMLTGCAARDIAKAKTAYANGDYQTVVELLENLKTRSRRRPSCSTMRRSISRLTPATISR